MENFGGVFFILIGLVVFFTGIIGIRTGEIKTRKSFMRSTTWYREYNPKMFKFVVGFYLLGGILITVLGVLSQYGIVDLNKEYHLF